MPIINSQWSLDQHVAEFVAGLTEPERIATIAEEKIQDLALYFKNHNIENVVFGLSGGVDSACVLALLNQVADRQPLSIFAETIGFSQYDGIFDQRMVELLKDDFRSSAIIYGQSDFKKSFENEFMQTLNMRTCKPEVRANMNYAMRYLAFFTIAQQVGGITIGTTNKDEFSYVGWFGKNSDMMVDLQPIMNWNKCEVRAVARHLGVPEEIITRAPVGDLIDRSSDEDNFGCTYDELAYYVHLKDKGLYVESEFMKEKFAKVRELHKKNYHKYLGQGYNPVRIS